MESILLDTNLKTKAIELYTNSKFWFILIYVIYYVIYLIVLYMHMPR